jgi:predicted negative regulator of RcsB-dependent stress response
MKLGQKKEALKAYKKSLALNPQNDNARKIIEENK